MIYLIFTLDYEIFGNGKGTIKHHIVEPTQKLNDVFIKYGYNFVNFVEVAELIKIKEYKTDPYIQNVEAQIKNLYNDGHEIALHLHPQWFNAKYSNNEWILDYDEYNLSSLDINKIDSYIESGTLYLRKVLDSTVYVPISFRAGGWLIQPSSNISKVLVKKGIKIESSVFKGGLQRYYNLDFTNYPKKLFYWQYSDDVLTPDSHGKLFEIPIYTENVFFWKMISKKRQNIYFSAQSTILNNRQLYLSYLDKIRIKYPKKFDFAKMTFIEMKETLNRIIEADAISPDKLKPIVLIGHSKNMKDLESIDKFLGFLQKTAIPVTTFKDIAPQLYI